MDIFAILRSIRRHWLVTALVVVLTGVASAWLLLVMPRDYEARASFVLVNPAPAPSDAQIERDPTLAGINRNNPYLRFANEGTVGQVLSARVGGGTVREALVAQGADAGYTIGPSPTSAQIVDLVGTGSSAAEAETTLALVSARMEAELVALQKVYDADESALIKPLPVAEPTPGHVVVSGTIRSLVGIVGAGVILLFAAISIAEGRSALRREEARKGRHEAPEDDGTESSASVVAPRTDVPVTAAVPGPRPEPAVEVPAPSPARLDSREDEPVAPDRRPQPAGARADG
ncbi:hypothetical protein [Geodermatophilus nigrescens]|uniref:Capsular polysaccharide biosynthesis protein n=1 Tax=Geodermatophilus nigrescens TaxID=1070870 RepID=A0A1M5E5Q3_9ACTN|nr:hypothetical protein [Geodermatophilus nigrescens]SHF74391.1 hypothetical protein SAMN05444351_0658 [Geodermatophilus nigrescens]